MTATPGTIPALTPYQPGPLPITGQEVVEIASSSNATSAVSARMLITDVVGKAASALPSVNPVSNDIFAFYQSATGLPKACTLANFGVPFGNVGSGGTAGQVYAKNSAANFDATWFSINTFVSVGTSLATSGTATSVVAFVANGGITSTQLGAAAVLRANVTAAAIGSAQLDNNAVLRANLTAAAVGSAQLDIGAILRTNLTAVAVGSAQIDVGAVLRTNLTAAAVGSAQIDTGAVLRTNLTAAAVGSAQLDLASVSLATTVTGVLPVANGGVGTSTLTSNAVLFGSGAATVGLATGGSTGSVLLANNGTPFFSPFLNTLGFSRVTTANGALSTTGFTAVLGLTASLAATSNYFFQARLFVTAGSTGGAQFNITVSTTVANIIYELSAISAGTLVGGSRATANSGALAIATSATTPTVNIRGFVTTNSSGTLVPQIAQLAATTTTSLVLAGSTLEVYQVA